MYVKYCFPRTKLPTLVHVALKRCRTVKSRNTRDLSITVLLYHNTQLEDIAFNEISIMQLRQAEVSLVFC